MAIVYNWPTSAALQGALELNRVHRTAAQEDLGFKVEKLISSVNQLNTVVSDLISGALSANASAVTWSSLSGYVQSTFVQASNFRASHPA
jgi:hypothetical protein